MGCTEKRQLNLIQEAEERNQLGKYSESVELLRKAISLHPESKAALKAIYKLGFALETYLKDYPAALFHYKEFIRLGKDSVSLYEVQKRIAAIYFDQMKNYEKAIEAYKNAMLLNPENLESDFLQFRVAQSYFRQNKFEQARKEYQDLLGKYSKTHYAAQSRFEIGNTYYMEGKYDIAIEALKQVLRIHPQNDYATEAQFLIAQCLEQQDKLPNAMQAYESIVGRYQFPDILRFRIEALKKRIKQKK